MKRIKGWRLLLVSIGLFVPFLDWMITRISMAQHFDNACTYHIDNGLSGPINSFQLQELEKAIDYLKRRGFTAGHTSVASYNVDEDVGFFYGSLVLKRDFLRDVLDGKLTDYSQMSDYGVFYTKQTVKVPDGISVFPHNVAFFWWGLLSLIVAAMGGFGLYVYSCEVND